MSAEEEHRRILAAALEKEEDGNARPDIDEQTAAPKDLEAEPKKKRTLIDAFRELGEIAPDFEFGSDRNNPPSPEVMDTNAGDAKSFKEHLLSDEFLVDDFPLPAREPWPTRDIRL